MSIYTSFLQESSAISTPMSIKSIMMGKSFFFIAYRHFAITKFLLSPYLTFAIWFIKFPTDFIASLSVFVFMFFLSISVIKLLFCYITSPYVFLKLFMEPTCLALSPLTNKNLIVLIDSAISEEIDTFAWESLSTLLRIYFILSFSLGKKSSVFRFLSPT